MAGGYFTRHLARMRLAYKRRMEAFAAALRAALPGVELDGVHSGLHFLLTLPGAGGERAMVAAAARALPGGYRGSGVLGPEGGRCGESGAGAGEGVAIVNAPVGTGHARPAA